MRARLYDDDFSIIQTLVIHLLKKAIHKCPKKSAFTKLNNSFFHKNLLLLLLPMVI